MVIHRIAGDGLDNVRKYSRILLNIVIPVLQIILVCWLGPKLLAFFLPFVIGWVIALIANPLVRWLEKRVKLVRKHSSFVIVVVVLAGIIGVGYLIISRLFREAVSLAKDIPEVYQMVMAEMQMVFARFDNLFQIVPKEVRQAVDEFAGNVGQTISGLAQQFAAPTVEAAGSVAKAIPGALVYTVVTILSSYFFIAQQDKLMEFVKHHMPEGMSRYFGLLRGDIRHLIGGYFLAQFKIMFVVAGILLAGFLILGIDHAVLLALIISLLDFLPMFGTGTALIPWSIYQVLAGDYAMAAGMILLYVLSQVVRQMIQPKIVGDSMGLPPLLTLFLLYLGFKVSGLSGMILAVPLGMIVLNLYGHGAFDGLISNLRILIQDIQKFRKESDDSPE